MCNFYSKLNHSCFSHFFKYHLGPCKFGAPLAVSHPHFLDTDPEFFTRVVGLNPDPKKHHFYMVMNPQMGIGMAAYVRMQMNLHVEKSKAFPKLMNLPIGDDEDVYIPIIWVTIIYFLDGIFFLSKQSFFIYGKFP